MLLFFTMFAIGLLVGFAGVGGSGMVIAILNVAFNVPIHTALGTALGATGFTTLAGSISHFREQNVAVKCGLAVGAFGAAGAYLGVKIATMLPSDTLTRWTAFMLLFAAGTLCCRLIFLGSKSSQPANDTVCRTGSKFWTASAGIGLIAGVLSGAFGIGAAPLIQLGLIVFFRLSLPEVAGTTMLVTLPVTFMGGFGYLKAGYLDMHIFIIVIVGLMSGTYIGAKFTRRLPPAILKTVMIGIPVIAALMLLFGS
jgi:uncharacterized membrane protein YfcA